MCMTESDKTIAKDSTIINQKATSESERSYWFTMLEVAKLKKDIAKVRLEHERLKLRQAKGFGQ